MNDKQTYQLVEGICLIMGEDGISTDKASIICNMEKNKLLSLIAMQEMIILEDESRSGYIKHINGTLIFKLKDDFNDIFKSLKTGKAPRLTDINIEVLTIIAYEQPITRSKINFIRGINSDNSIQKLLNLKLIARAGIDSENFNATLYKTTKKFLDYMQIKSINDLPDYQEIKKEVESES
jgi:segregation and condensation protein B